MSNWGDVEGGSAGSGRGGHSAGAAGALQDALSGWSDNDDDAKDQAAGSFEDEISSIFGHVPNYESSTHGDHSGLYIQQDPHPKKQEKEITELKTSDLTNTEKRIPNHLLKCFAELIAFENRSVFTRQLIKLFIHEPDCVLTLEDIEQILPKVLGLFRAKLTAGGGGPQSAEDDRSMVQNALRELADDKSSFGMPYLCAYYNFIRKIKKSSKNGRVIDPSTRCRFIFKLNLKNPKMELEDELIKKRRWAAGDT